MARRRRTLRRRLVYDALLTGVPFGIFKMAIGWIVWQRLGMAWGVLALAWGALDVLLNGLAIVMPRHLSFCLLSNVGRWLARGRGGRLEEQLLALDTFLAFAIVAAMIGFHWIPLLPPALARAWDTAVIFNVLGVGVERLFLALRRRDEMPPSPPVRWTSEGEPI